MGEHQPAGDAGIEQAYREAMAAAQGIEFRAPLTTSAPLQDVLARLRAKVPAIGADRLLAPDIAAAAAMVADGTLASGLDLPVPA